MIRVISLAGHYNWLAPCACARDRPRLEVVPLVLLILDAWDFITAGEGDVDAVGKRVMIEHRCTFYFLMAICFWNFLGAACSACSALRC
jgi:nitric oxide reductase large subunit